MSRHEGCRSARVKMGGLERVPKVCAWKHLRVIVRLNCILHSWN